MATAIPHVEVERPQNGLGGMLMASSSVAFTGMAAAVKIAAVDMSPWLVVLVRSLVVVVVALAMLRMRGKPVRFVNTRLLLARSAAGFGAMIAYFWAISAGPFADVIALQYTSPLLVAALAPLVLGEPTVRRTWGLLLVGFSGAVVLLRPGGELQPALLGALASAVLSALAYLSLRSLRQSDDPDCIVLFFAGFSTLASAPILLTLDGLPSPSAIGALLVVGLCASAGQMFVTRAYRIGEAAVMSGVGYIAVPLGALMSVVAFGQGLTPWAIVGGLLVVGAGVGLAASSRAV